MKRKRSKPVEGLEKFKREIEAQSHGPVPVQEPYVPPADEVLRCVRKLNIALDRARQHDLHFAITAENEAIENGSVTYPSVGVVLRIGHDKLSY